MRSTAKSRLQHSKSHKITVFTGYILWAVFGAMVAISGVEWLLLSL